MQEILLKDNTVIKYEKISNLNYGVPKEKLIESNKWEDLLRLQNYRSGFNGDKNRKGRISCKVDYTDKHCNRDQKRIYKDDFISIKIYDKIKIYKLKDFKMDRLIKELNGEDFIRLLKDEVIKKIERQI